MFDNRQGSTAKMVMREVSKTSENAAPRLPQTFVRHIYTSNRNVITVKGEGELGEEAEQANAEAHTQRAFILQLQTRHRNRSQQHAASAGRYDDVTCKCISRASR